jgi:hypothetical protein
MLFHESLSALDGGLRMGCNGQRDADQNEDKKEGMFLHYHTMPERMSRGNDVGQAQPLPSLLASA